PVGCRLHCTRWRWTRKGPVDHLLRFTSRGLLCELNGIRPDLRTGILCCGASVFPRWMGVGSGVAPLDSVCASHTRALSARSQRLSDLLLLRHSELPLSFHVASVNSGAAHWCWNSPGLLDSGGRGPST